MGKTKAQLRKDARHLRLYHSIMDSAAWRHLSPPAVKVLLELVRQDNGERNGALAFSARRAHELTGLSVRTCWRCLKELQDKGFIRCTQKGAFSRKVLHASLWRYTWQAWPEGKMGPTRDFEKWQPDGKTRMQNLPRTDANSALETETPPLPDANSAFDEVETPLVSKVSTLEGNATLTIYQREPTQSGETYQRKQANPTSGAFLDTLRADVLDRLAHAAPGAQTRLAEHLGIPGGTFSKFLSGRGLADRHADALRAALRSAA